MKHRDLIKLFENKGWYLKREGGNHEVYTDGEHDETIPRHREINEKLARALIKKWKL